MSEKLRRTNVIHQRKTINKTFKFNAKSIYRRFRNEKEMVVDSPPGEDEIHSFWNGIWGKEKTFNRNAVWLEDVQGNYCRTVEKKEYLITKDIVKEVIKGMNNKKAPGNDLVIHIWHKKLHSTWSYITKIFQNYMNKSTPIPEWLPQSKTMLLPKTEDTENPIF